MKSMMAPAVVNYVFATLNLLVLLLGHTAAFSQSQPSRVQRAYTSNAKQYKTFMSFLNEPWTGNDKPFIAIRREVDALLASKKLTPAYLSRVRARALSKGATARDIFRWGYALFQSRYSTFNFGLAASPYEVRMALAQVPSPRSYQYARLRFLIEGRANPNPEFAGLGRRLLRRNPNDYYVKFYAVWLLTTGTSMERAEALKYANELTKQYPTRAGSHNAMARVYYDRWRLSRQVSDANKSIAAYRRCLQYMARSDNSRDDIEYMIQLIEKQKAEQS